MKFDLVYSEFHLNANNPKTLKDSNKDFFSFVYYMEDDMIPYFKDYIEQR